ncbi:Glycerol-3-phosphate acyltransferase 5 [Apostasia shenzhenica]|uniref:Glycerol-3-phosphate acyltransferase 5 n=1 Tax=Apostasia shenzhenica TaxID=1088818 RepID=A0A2I0B617_9ASPA|nr:Glycerol-3-phosphate acyltransferase 5 [Apostasia shenzhenica]
MGGSNRPSMAAELEGCLLRDSDPFPYFMLMAFEAPAGLLRFAALLLLWPLLRLLRSAGKLEAAMNVMVFTAIAGVRAAEVEAAAGAVLPKFFMENVDMEAWGVYGRWRGRRVVVTAMPRVMAERFAKEHLRADEVVGRELEVRWKGIAVGWLKRGEGSAAELLKQFVGPNGRLDAGLARSPTAEFMVLCKVTTSA